jgi:hypothetical protein
MVKVAWQRPCHGTAAIAGLIGGGPTEALATGGCLWYLRRQGPHPEKSWVFFAGRLAWLASAGTGTIGR